jgi:outer membrane lipoprotein-sorting protein
MQNLISVFLIFIFASSLFAIDKKSLFNELKEEFKELNSIEIYFVNRDTPEVTGHIIAKKGNKYRITMGDRIISSDGVTVWNYSITQNTVLISNFKEINSGSLENLFFTEINNSKPISLNTINSTSKPYKYELKIQNDETEMSYKIFLSDSKKIYSVLFDDIDEEWILEKLNKNISTPVSFEPKFDKDVEIIDLR